MWAVLWCPGYGKTGWNRDQQKVKKEMTAFNSDKLWSQTHPVSLAQNKRERIQILMLFLSACLFILPETVTSFMSQDFSSGSHFTPWLIHYKFTIFYYTNLLSCSYTSLDIEIRGISLLFCVSSILQNTSYIVSPQ